MGREAVVRAKINQKIKDDAKAILDGFGITISDYLRMSLSILRSEGKLPFNIGPNQETAEAIRRSKRGLEPRVSATNAKELFKKIGV